MTTTHGYQTSYTLGDRVRVTTLVGEELAVITSVDKEGGLKYRRLGVRFDDGTRMTVGYDQIRPLRVLHATH